jgi:hypothetical protein
VVPEGPGLVRPVLRFQGFKPRRHPRQKGNASLSVAGPEQREGLRTQASPFIPPAAR